LFLLAVNQPHALTHRLTAEKKSARYYYFRSAEGTRFMLATFIHDATGQQVATKALRKCTCASCVAWESKTNEAALKQQNVRSRC
jgi:hypothetical protein